MALRSSILTHALPHLPITSFTRQALLTSLSRLPTDHPDYRAEGISDSVLDTLFGDGRGAEGALVGAWADEGVREIRGDLKGEGEAGTSSWKGTRARIGERLGRRLEYSARVGEHLVEVCSSSWADSPWILSYSHRHRLENRTVGL